MGSADLADDTTSENYGAILKDYGTILEYSASTWVKMWRIGMETSDSLWEWWKRQHAARACVKYSDWMHNCWDVDPLIGGDGDLAPWWVQGGWDDLIQGLDI